MAEHRILIVANRTLGGEHLVEAARQRVAAGADAIWVVVPVGAAPEDPTSSRNALRFGELASSSWMPGLSVDPPGAPDTYEVAEARLARAKDQLRTLGVAVGGEVGDEDPLKAIGDALATHPSEEILMSTLPRATSHWLRVDLPAERLGGSASRSRRFPLHRGSEAECTG